MYFEFFSFVGGGKISKMGFALGAPTNECIGLLNERAPLAEFERLLHITDADFFTHFNPSQSFHCCHGTRNTLAPTY
jgi:hypothetical protein